MVVFGHLQTEAALMPAAAAYGFSPVIVDLTGAGVDLFFVISGFVMVFASRDLFGQKYGARLFLARRMARIVPLYWAATTLFLATMLLSPASLSSAAPSLAEIVKSYLFIPFARAGAEAIQPVYKLGWTLNYEMFFYAIFALCLFLPRQKAVGAVVGILVILAGGGLWWRQEPGAIAFWSHPIVLEFGCGALLANARMNGLRWPGAACAALALAGVAGFAASVYFSVPAHGVLRPLVWGIPAALLIASAALGDSGWPQGRLAGLALLLGDASYSIYLVHPILIRVMRLVWDKSGASVTLNPWVFVGGVMLLIVMASVLVYRWFEKPATRWAQEWPGVGRRVLPVPQKATAAA